MNFDAYVNHISQKYRLAIAISVIKTKPNDLTIDEYLTRLQRKIRDMESDPNETVCSDDFNFNDEFSEQNQQEKSVNINNGNEIDNKSNRTLINNSMHEHCQGDSQSSQTILNGFVFGDVPSSDVHAPNLENEFGYTLNLLKEATDCKQTNEQPFQNYQNLSQPTYCESQEVDMNNEYNNHLEIRYDIANKTHNNNAIENNNNDSQESELYTLEGFTQNYTHVSQTQEEQFVISDKFIRSKVDNVKTAELTQGNVITIQNGVEYPKNNKLDTQDGIDNGHIQTRYDDIQNESSNTVNNKKEFNEQNTIQHGHDIQTLYGYEENEATNKYIEPVYNKGKTSIQNNDHSFNRATEECINIIDYTEIVNEVDTNYMNIDYSRATEVNKVLEERNENFEEVNEHFKERNQHFEEGNEMEVDEKTDSDDNSQAVKVPFKVLEELNRVRAFLNKKDRRYIDGYSTDSGYRSDSQVRGSLKSSSQSTVVWLNQSAHCLFTYIMQAPTGCRDITNEISKVLGQLIDRLHDEENYPPFLDELLEAVDSLILDTHEACSWAEHDLITKDGNTYRLVLLNKSKHILKHSIENITGKLEKLHTNLTQQNLYEHTNTNEIENACYIFHILEMFLKKYVKAKTSSQVSTQNSQEEDRFPKRSSLTDLWRKKWNPNYKEIVSQENVSVCVLKKCSEILNKIIVECMDGYSLISFAALQCFNSIQS